MLAWLDRVFHIGENNSTVHREVTGGLTTFLTMSYIVFVQPQVLKAAGMDYGAVFTATCLSSALACFLMGIVANYPIAQAPLMGENFYFAYVLVLGMGVPWQKALGLVFISGVCFMLLNITKLRSQLVNSIPETLKFGISAGIGLFIAFIGLQQAGIVVGSQGTLVQLGSITKTPILISLFGLAVMSVLFARGVKWAILLGMGAAALAAWITGLISLHGVFSLPPSMAPTFMKLDLSGILSWDSIPIVLLFLFITIFDTVGTLIGVGVQGGFMKDGHLPRVERALVSDSVATTVGACLGTSTVSSFIESATGIAQGARTGLAAIVVGLLFLLSLFFAPLAATVGGEVLFNGAALHPITAPALIMVGALMMGSIRHVRWNDFTDALPAFLIVALIPLTFNMMDGIAAGLVAYPLLKTFVGKWREVPALVWILAVLLALRYVLL